MLALLPGDQPLVEANCMSRQISFLSSSYKLLTTPLLANGGYIHSSRVVVGANRNGSIKGICRKEMKPSRLPVSCFRDIVDGRMNTSQWALEGARAGLDGIDLSVLFQKSGDPAYLDKTRQEIEEAGIQVAMVTTYPDFTQPTLLNANAVSFGYRKISSQRQG